MRVFKSADSEFTFVFLNSLPKIPSLGKNGSKTFVLNKNWYVGVFKGSNSEFNNFFFFFNSVPKILVLYKFGPETSKCFVSDKTRYIAVFNGADSEFNNFFLRFLLKSLF